MSSKDARSKIFLQVVSDGLDQAYRKRYGTAGSGADADRRAAGLVDLANERAVGAGDLAVDVARLILRTGIAVAEEVVQGASQLDSVLAGKRGDSSGGRKPSPDDADTAASPPAAAMLPAVSPGRTTSVAIAVRNDSLDEVDDLRLQCAGLYGSSDVRIPGHQIKFEPATIDVDPESAEQVTCTVNVPADAKRGHYTGLIEAAGLSGVQLLVSLDVR